MTIPIFYIHYTCCHIRANTKTPLFSNTRLKVLCSITDADNFRYMRTRRFYINIGRRIWIDWYWINWL